MYALLLLLLITVRKYSEARDYKRVTFYKTSDVPRSVNSVDLITSLNLLNFKFLQENESFEKSCFVHMHKSEVASLPGVVFGLSVRDQC